MKYQLLFDNFMDAVQAAAPKNKKPARVLAEILNISIEAVYRRLRLEVPFSFAEIAAVSKHLGFSVDNIIYTDSGLDKPLHISYMDCEDPVICEYGLLERFINYLKEINKSNDSEVFYCMNTIPLTIYLKSEIVTRFFLFKWRYMFENNENKVFLKDIIIPEKLKRLHQKLMEENCKVNRISYIMDSKVVNSIATDIRFFSAINRITSENVKELKGELLNLIDYTEEMIGRNSWRDHSKLEFYISPMDLSNTYVYCKGKKSELSLYRTFIINAIYTHDRKTCERTRKWIQSIRQSSTQISGSGEQHRIIYFNRQREIVNAI